jgi:hypothetical protein
MLWQKSQAVHERPSVLLGMEPDSYEAFCLDEATIYFGLTVESKLASAGQKESKEERRSKAAREAMMDRLFNADDETKSGSGFADPALMFG